MFTATGWFLKLDYISKLIKILKDVYDRYEQKLYIQFLSDYRSEHSTRSVSIS